MQTEMVDTIYGQFCTIADDLVTQQLKTYSAHTRNEIAMLLSVLREQDIVLDIGAHIGTFAIPIVSSFKGNIKVFAFEPQADVFELLQKNIQLNNLGNCIVTFNGLVSNQKEEFRQRVTHSDNSMATMFIPVELDETSETIGKKADIKIYSIDQMIQEGDIPADINVVKIDTEGAELKVINSCLKLLKSNLPVVYGEINVGALEEFETTPDDIDAVLSAFGYHFFRNVGDRNSTNDSFKLARIKQLKNGGPFFDFLAIHPDSERYPSVAASYNYFSTANRLNRIMQNFRQR